MNIAADPLPRPPPEAIELSDRLVALIAAEIDAHGGWLAFDRYMDLVLYAPGLGYYSAGSVKLGAEGDFITAPEISTIFGRVFARELATRLAELDDPVIIELGAGSGRLADTVLAEFESRDLALPAYWILEPSADFKQRQQHALARLGTRVQWIERLPETDFEGVVIANEVADALPVSVFIKRGRDVVPLGVSGNDTALAWAAGPRDPALSRAIAQLEGSLGKPLADGYRSEICLRLSAWVAGLAARLERGSLVLIDYGLPRREYYHVTRASGTLMCHYRHRAHDDPFFFPGLQDLSAWVDFSACADAGRAQGLVIDGYTTQAQFLLHGGALEALAGVDDAGRPAEAQALKRLLLPGEMGERFKLLGMSRGIDAALPGRDFRDRL